MDNNSASIDSTIITRPVSGAERIKTVDMIRGFALLGILLMNIPGFGLDYVALFDIARGPESGKDYYAMAGMFAFFDGTMRGLFSMLFGAGMILFTMNKKDTLGGPTVADYYFRRLLWLVVFGLFNAFILLWPGDILYFYGLCGMLLFAFRKAKPYWLILLAIACIFIGIFKAQLTWNEVSEKRKGYKEAIAAEKDKKTLTDEQTGAKEAWIELQKNFTPDTAIVNHNIRQVRSGYTTVFEHFIPMNAGNETWGMYHGVWDFLTMMFFGMALFKLGFFSNKLATSTYAITLLLGYGIGIPMGWEYFHTGVLGFYGNHLGEYIDAWRVPPHAALYDFRRLFLSIGHASLLLLVFRSKIVPWLMRALANVGQMAFTNYLMQSIICTIIFNGYGFGYYHKLSFHQLYYVVLVVWVFQLIVSSIWLRFFRFGPFEWLWRSLTYWKRQPMLNR